jgi:hypothetical protein
MFLKKRRLEALHLKPSLTNNLIPFYTPLAAVFILWDAPQQRPYVQNNTAMINKKKHPAIARCNLPT